MCGKLQTSHLWQTIEFLFETVRICHQRGSSRKLQKLYYDLIDLGKQNIETAMVVGARVEELDIYDLERLMAQTSNSDILTVYENLTKGSRNHLRSFNSQINRYGVDFNPEYISQAEFEGIISSAHERGRR